MRFSTVWNTPDTLPKIKDLFQKELTENSKPNIIQKFFGHSNSLIWNLLITSVVLIIILPLLSYSNPYFAQFISGIYESTIRWILEFFNWTIICRVLIFFYFLAYLPRLLCYYQKDIPENRETREFNIPIPKLAIILSLGGFLIAQLQVYLNPQLLGLTAGNQAREIFFHLSAVCLIVFLLLYINLKKNLLARVTSALLLIQSAFLVGIAFNSDWNYVNSWGLTHLRLYGFSLIALIVGCVLVFGASMIPVFKDFSKRIGLTQTLALVFCFVLVVTNVINFDAMIYKNPPRETQGIAYSYIASMSIDSMSLAREYELVKEVKELRVKPSGFCADRSYYNENTIKYLQAKYSKFQFISFNWNEYQNYYMVKDIAVEDIATSKSRLC